MMENQSREWILEMIEFMHKFNADLRRPASSSTPEGWPTPARPRPSASRTASRSPPTARTPSRRSRSPATGSSTSRTRRARSRSPRGSSPSSAIGAPPIEVRQVMDAPPESVTRRRRHRGPAARAGAAGPRHARAAARPVRRLRGRRAGGTARRGAAVGGRRACPTTRASWLVTVAVATTGRRVAQRERPPPARGDRRRARAARPRAQPAGPGRHAHAAVPVLPPLAVGAVAAGADPARGRRADDRGDRERLPGSGSHDGPAHQPREAEHQEHGHPLRPAARAGAGRAPARRAAGALSRLQRGLHDQLRPRAAAGRPDRRGDPAGAHAPPAACRARARSPACSRSCC